MDDALFVGVLESGGDLLAVAHGLDFGEPPAFGHQLADAQAVDVLHDEVWPAGDASRVVDADNAGMAEPGDDTGLTFEGTPELIAVVCAAQDLYGHPAAEAQIFGEPNLGHATRSERPFEAVSFSDDVGSVQLALSVNAIAVALKSGQRNAELMLLAASAGFLLLGWRSFAAADFALPETEGRIVVQFFVSVFLGHVGLRLAAPRASAVPYATAMLLAAVGLVFTTRLAPDVAQDQANWISLGVALMVGTVAAGRHYARLRRYRYTAALAAVMLLLATGVFGTTINGARLWVTVGGQVIQTTELIKLLLVVFLAGYLADEGAVLSMPRLTFGGRTYSALPYLVPLLVALLATVAALALLRDLGSVALLLLLAVSLLYVATGRLRFVVGGMVLLLGTAALCYVVFGHVERRIDTWLDPYADASGAGYQSIQATYAIQAGGITGEGLGLGQPEEIPAAATDYVFSAIAEELGLAGAVAIVALYVLLLFAGLRVALDVPDSYSRLLAASVVLLIALQAAVIIAGNLRIIPTTGITLPFVSYGGSSVVVNFVLVGGLLAISGRNAAR